MSKEDSTESGHRLKLGDCQLRKGNVDTTGRHLQVMFVGLGSNTPDPTTHTNLCIEMKDEAHDELLSIGTKNLEEMFTNLIDEISTDRNYEVDAIIRGEQCTKYGEAKHADCVIGKVSSSPSKTQYAGVPTVDEKTCKFVESTEGECCLIYLTEKPSKSEFSYVDPFIGGKVKSSSGSCCGGAMKASFEGVSSKPHLPGDENGVKRPFVEYGVYPQGGKTERQPTGNEEWTTFYQDREEVDPKWVDPEDDGEWTVQIEKVQQECDDAEDELTKCQEEVDLMSKECGDSEKVYRSMMMRLKEEVDKKCTLEGKFKTAVEVYETASAEHVMLKGELDKQAKQRDMLNRAMSDLREKEVALQRDVMCLNEKNANLEMKIKFINRERNCLEADNQELLDMVKWLLEYIEFEDQQKLYLEMCVTKLSGEVQASREQRTYIEYCLELSAKLTKEYQEMCEKERVELNQKIKQFHEVKAACDKKVDELECEIDQLKQKLQESEARLVKLESDNAAMNIEIEELKAMCEKLGRENTALKAQLEAKQFQLQERTEELKAKQVQVQGANQKLQMCQAMMAQQRYGRINVQERELDALYYADEMQKKAKLTEDQNDRLASWSEELHEENMTLEEKVLRLQKEIQCVRQEKEELKEKLAYCSKRRRVTHHSSVRPSNIKESSIGLAAIAEVSDEGDEANEEGDDLKEESVEELQSKLKTCFAKNEFLSKQLSETKLAYEQCENDLHEAKKSTFTSRSSSNSAGVVEPRTKARMERANGSDGRRGKEVKVSSQSQIMIIILVAVVLVILAMVVIKRSGPRVGMIFIILAVSGVLIYNINNRKERDAVYR